MTKATRKALERYERQGWILDGPTLAPEGGPVPAPEARDKRQSRVGGVGFVARLRGPGGAPELYGHGGTPEEAVQDILAQADRLASERPGQPHHKTGR
jgi:hypothetical protein